MYCTHEQFRCKSVQWSKSQCRADFYFILTVCMQNAKMCLLYLCSSTWISIGINKISLLYCILFIYSILHWSGRTQEHIEKENYHTVDLDCSIRASSNIGPPAGVGWWACLPCLVVGGHDPSVRGWALSGTLMCMYSRWPDRRTLSFSRLLYEAAFSCELALY